MSTLLITHPAFLEHLTPLGHPERPDRLRAIERALEAEKFQTLARSQAPLASLDAIALCHPMQYITEVREAAPREGLIHLDADTAMSPGTFEAALRAAGRAKHSVPRGVDQKGGQRLRRGTAARPPRRNSASDGFLFVRQCRDCRALFATDLWSGYCGHHRFRRAPRQWFAGDFLVGQNRHVLLDPSNAFVSRDRRGGRDRRAQYDRQRAIASGRWWSSVSRRVRDEDSAAA